MEIQFDLIWLGERIAEDTFRHLWGYGRFNGKTYTFWRLKRTEPIVFKDIDTYGRATREAILRGGIEAKREEQIRKGYAEVVPSPSRRKRIENEFLIASAFTGLHVPRRRG